MLMSLFASERKRWRRTERGAKRDMELMQRAIRTWSSGCHRAIVLLRERTRRESEVATVPRPPSRETSRRSSATSAVASPSDFHGLGKLHARDRALPVTAWSEVKEVARIGMTTACTAFAMVSVEPWLHWLAELPRSVRSVVLAPSEERERQFLAAHRIARLGLFLTLTLTHTHKHWAQVQCSQIAEYHRV